MEKCTFCVQRIRRGVLDAKIEKRKVQDGEIRPACVQACASEALVFGLLSDPESTVSRTLEKNSSRAVAVHAEHDTRPHVLYLKPMRDPEPLEAADKPMGESREGRAEASPTPGASPSPQASPSASASPSTPTPSPATPAPVAPASPGMPATVTPSPAATATP
jgi:hypothetical protein